MCRGYHPDQLRRLVSRMPNLSEGDRASIKAPIALTEIEVAIDALVPGDSSDPDGIIRGYFKKCISPLLLILFT